MRRLAAFLGALGMVLGIGLVNAPAAAATTIEVAYSYHYDNHCHPLKVVYVGEPYTPGWAVRWWYRDYRKVEYASRFEQLWFGLPPYRVLQRWTVFSHREYPKALACRGVW